MISIFHPGFQQGVSGLIVGFPPRLSPRFTRRFSPCGVWAEIAREPDANPCEDYISLNGCVRGGVLVARVILEPAGVR